MAMDSVQETSKTLPHLLLDKDPYTDLGAVGLGMTGYILGIDDDRVVKVAKTYPVENSEDFFMEHVNESNREALVTEIEIYQRLGRHEGIIHCFQTTNFGIEMVFAKQGDLETYINSNPEPTEPFKIHWILSLIDGLSYIHSRKVLVDEIALRNILVDNGQLRFADFGQSYLLPLSTNMDTICENDLTVKIEILHLGWIIYSIACWKVHKYYFFGEDRYMEWPTSDQLPPLKDLFCGAIVENCWKGNYVNVDALKQHACSLLLR
ncbi:uncharacterized protein HMPREF1120_00101 [Exophiala dermatitidis NIH/UT8656]|uniref:Protein kinase domain-containing protein n=1 Tax=Exophiala dermatitidis (strain ATCC 34100 / CBS 525.76 / NIH/UT8656) TaxID=858893 RepID=H6BLI5_EXODN|nr:uncharacterized protein HMPREF1120_00101 [Exophiala dermatitidis NIH/UT8656]EHY51878.1 hypothetical protein HMPREF1120_00101 [Exophiala dermatitidis NIH/UT8656]